MAGARTGLNADSAPRVSVVIPTRNRAWCLPRAVESVLTQTAGDLELVVADNASEDDTPRLLAAAAAADPRLRVVRRHTPGEMVANWSLGLAQARGDLLLLLMDDDWLQPEFLARRLAALEETPRALAVTGPHAEGSEDGSEVRLPESEPPAGLLEGTELVRAALGRSWFLSSTLYRMEPLQRCWPRASEDGLVPDYSLNLLLALDAQTRGGCVVRLRGADMVVRRHGGQHSEGQRERVFRETETILCRMLRDEAALPVRAMVRRELADWRVSHARYLASQGRIGEARAHLWKAAAADPGSSWAWRQLLLSWLRPGYGAVCGRG